MNNHARGGTRVVSATAPGVSCLALGAFAALVRLIP